MEQKKKLFKYYVIRVCNMVVFRRTVSSLKLVKSRLYKPRTEFRLEQISYSGGQAIGCMSYADWTRYGGRPLNLNNCSKITREQYRSMEPYISKE
jgi:hypothetical protein